MCGALALLSIGVELTPLRLQFVQIFLLPSQPLPVMAGLVPRVSGTDYACRAAAFPSGARASRRRFTARVACDPKSNLACCCSEVGGGRRSSAIVRRSTRLVLMSRAK